uniref:Ribonuclease H-like domain-containing protein n=1 Tax=Tanacetum cinerariifolium TaxID=118510 RepID=A0A699IF70_TANCI|nr:ribonuclease H-like domain-containing protein [Tanacetum cinerariifolium]GEZ43670.1 ribonuclease H-like domain-containing protein [Tanacetum cinerariifolium]
MRNISVNEKADVDYASEAKHLNFFNNQLSQSPYDEGRATSVVEDGPSFSRTDTEASQLSKNGTATQVKDTSLSEGNLSETKIGSSSIPTHNLTFESIDRVQSEPKRSSRVSKIPVQLNDYVIDSKLKYGLEKHVSYAKLNSVNYCFATTLNKSVKPTNYYKAATDPSNSWPLYQSDVNNAFLYGDLIMDVYMTLPLGFGDNSDNKFSLRVLIYLKRAPGTGVQFYKSSNLSLKAFSDADWAKCPVTKKSVLGVVIMIEIFCDRSSANQIASNPGFMKKQNILKLMFIFGGLTVVRRWSGGGPAVVHGGPPPLTGGSGGGAGDKNGSDELVARMLVRVAWDWLRRFRSWLGHPSQQWYILDATCRVAIVGSKE